MDLGLKGRVAVVTGASKGIGLAITGALAAEGVQVIAGVRGTSSGLSALAATSAIQAVEVDLSTADAQTS